MDLGEIEQRLRQEDTLVLQHKLRTNSYVEEVKTIAETILADRNEQIPVAETEEEVEAKFVHNNKISLIVLLLCVVYVVVLYVGDVTTVRFILFTAALVFAIRYTLSRKIK